MNGNLTDARGPKREKRPADIIGAAIMVGKTATGEIVFKQRHYPKCQALTGGFRPVRCATKDMRRTARALMRSVRPMLPCRDG
jgi:hypothetical protein